MLDHQPGSAEYEIASARAAVEDLKRRGELSVGDRETLLTGLDALAAQAARDRTEPPAAEPARYPGEPGSLADIGRQRFEREEREYR